MTEIKPVLARVALCSAMFSGIGLSGLMLQGCSSSPTPNYYSLTPLFQGQNQNSNRQVRVIEVLPVGLSDRLNRIPLVLQNSQGAAQVLNDDRWTSTMAAELRDGLSAGLQQKLGAFDRYNSGMTGGKAAYRIAADFSHFDFIQTATATANSPKGKHSKTANQVLIAVAWTVKLDDPNRPLTDAKKVKALTQVQQLSCRMQISQTLPQATPKLVDVVETARTSLAQVTQVIASSVLAFEQRRAVNLPNVVCDQ